MTIEEAKKIVVELTEQKIIEIQNRMTEVKREIIPLKQEARKKEEFFMALEKDLSVWQHSKAHMLLLREPRAKARS